MENVPVMLIVFRYHYKLQLKLTGFLAESWPNLWFLVPDPWMASQARLLFR